MWDFFIYIYNFLCDPSVKTLLSPAGLHGIGWRRAGKNTTCELDHFPRFSCVFCKLRKVWLQRWVLIWLSEGYLDKLDTSGSEEINRRLTPGSEQSWGWLSILWEGCFQQNSSPPLCLTSLPLLPGLLAWPQLPHPSAGGMSWHRTTFVMLCNHHRSLVSDISSPQRQTPYLLKIMEDSMRKRVTMLYSRNRLNTVNQL